jgi:hypothetical protein
MATILSIVQDAADIVGFPRPTILAASNNPIERQLRAIMNETGQYIANAHEWTKLLKIATITTVASEDQGTLDSLMPNFAWEVYETFWNYNQLRPLGAPSSSQHWQALKAFNVAGPYYDWRIRDGKLYLYPAPPAGEELTIEYVSKAWLRNAAGSATYDAITADTDVPLLDERLLKLEFMWRYKSTKGLPYAEEKLAADEHLNRTIARDGGMVTLRDTVFNESTFPLNMPEANWNIS